MPAGLAVRPISSNQHIASFPFLKGRTSKVRVLLLGAAAAYGLSAASVSAQEAEGSGLSVAASVGADYSTGDYGAAEETNVVLVPIILRARTGDLAISGSMTYIRIDGPADVVIGPDGEQLPGVPTDSGLREGWSDLSLGASYRLPVVGPAGTQFALSGRVKLPTSPASAQLSSGKFDYSVRGEVSASFGAITPFASVGYRFLGDPAGVNLRNGLSLSGGMSVSLGRKVLIASFDHSSASSARTQDSRSLFGGFSMPVGSGLNLTGYGVIGLSESSPNHGIGLLVTAPIL
jgi:hypothetical protein